MCDRFNIVIYTYSIFGAFVNPQCVLLLYSSLLDIRITIFIE